MTPPASQNVALPVIAVFWKGLAHIDLHVRWQGRRVSTVLVPSGAHGDRHPQLAAQSHRLLDVLLTGTDRWIQNDAWGNHFLGKGRRCVLQPPLRVALIANDEKLSIKLQRIRLRPQ